MFCNGLDNTSAAILMLLYLWLNLHRAPLGTPGLGKLLALSSTERFQGIADQANMLVLDAEEYLWSSALNMTNAERTQPKNGKQAKGRTTHRGTGQREHILKTAAQLFSRRGYHAIGMAELGEATQLGRGTLYHYIKSKEDLLYDITREYIEELAVSAEHILQHEADPQKRIVMLGQLLIEKIASHQAELTVCFREISSLTEPRRSEVLAFHSRYEGVWRSTMKEGAATGIFRPYDSVILKGVLGMYFYSYLWLRPEKTTPSVVSEHLNDLALRMLDRNGPAE